MSATTPTRILGSPTIRTLALRQHGEFVGQALDLIEATDAYPAEAQYRWTSRPPALSSGTCAVPSKAEIDRFRHWHEQGRIDIAAMQYNMTPLLNIEQMHRSLYPLRALRDEFGFHVEAAMQDDVNGVSWLFADLFADLGIKFYTAAINPIRGARPKPFPGAFRWQGPSGKEVLAWNGYHYLFGRSQAGLGNWDLVDRLLPRWIDELENDETYPFDFLYCKSTHPVRVDNGPPDARMPEFVKRWNEEGRPYRMEFVTVTDFGRLLREAITPMPSARSAATGPTTGLTASAPPPSKSASTAPRTKSSARRKPRSLAAAAKARATGTPRAAASIYEYMTLFDEHTWGAYSSVEAPHSLFTPGAVEPQGRLRLHRRDGGARPARARRTRAREAARTKPARKASSTSAISSRRRRSSLRASKMLLVINTLPWERKVIVEEPEPRGGAAPDRRARLLLQSPQRLGRRPPDPARAARRRHGPAMGYAFLKIADAGVPSDLKVPSGDDREPPLSASGRSQDRRPREFFDKEQGHDFAGELSRLGSRPVRLRGRSTRKDGRLAIANIDFAHPDFFVGHKDTPWKRERRDEGEARRSRRSTRAAPRSRSTIEAPGVAGATVIYALDAGTKSLVDRLDARQARQSPIRRRCSSPSRSTSASRNFTHRPQRHPGRAQCRPARWRRQGLVPAQRWVDVSDGKRGVTLVPLDAPLVHLGGITTGKWARTLQPEGPTIMSWALNNHWLVNFKSSQGGQHSAALPADDARGRGRSGRRGPLCR